MARHKSIFGIYRTRGAAENGVETLKNNGFRKSDISLLLPQETGLQTFIHTKESKAPEGAAAGAGAGAFMGGVLGLLAGAGALATPAVGPFVAAGPIMSALAGMGVGSTFGGISGALIGFGIPEYEARRYEGFATEGGILISVHVDDSEWSEKAESLLAATGAKDVAASQELKCTMDSFIPKNYVETDPFLSNRLF